MSVTSEEMARAMLRGLEALIQNKVNDSMPSDVDLQDAVHDYLLDGFPSFVDDAISDKVIEVLDQEIEQRINDWMEENLPDRIKITIE